MPVWGFQSWMEDITVAVQNSWHVFSFQLSDNSHQVFRNLRAGERTLDSEICFQNFLDRTADFYQNFYGFHISIFSSHFSDSNSVTFLCNTTLVGGFSSYVVSLPVAVPPSPINIFSQIRDSWHDLVLFRIVSRMFFFFFFSHVQKVQQTSAWRIIVACMHRWHAKPFYLLYINSQSVFWILT